MYGRLPRARASSRVDLSHRGGQLYFDEVFVTPGPTEVGVESGLYSVLYGSEWVSLIDYETSRRRIFQRTGAGWVERTADPRLPQNIFGQIAPVGERRLSLAFDQSARLVLGFEFGGQVFITRWDTTALRYVQNVGFAGVDPVVWMDATLTDPAGAPADLRASLDAGAIRLLHEWLPSGQWLETAVPDSDIIIFYLSPDRLRVEARVQRQLYATVHVLHTFSAPVILDRVQSLFGRYQLLVSDLNGVPLPQMLVSSEYIRGLMALITPSHPIAAAVSVEDIAHRSEEVNVLLTHPVTGAVLVENIVYQSADVIVLLTHPVTGGVSVETPIVYQLQSINITLTNPVTGGVSVETPIIYRHQDIPVALTHPVTGGVNVEDIVYRRV